MNWKGIYIKGVSYSLGILLRYIFFFNLNHAGQMKNPAINVIFHDSGHLKKYLLELAWLSQRFRTNVIGQQKVEWCHWLSQQRQVVCSLYLNSHTIFNLSYKINDSLQITNDCCLGLQDKFLCKVTTCKHHIFYKSLTDISKREITNLNLTLQYYHCSIEKIRGLR